METRGQGIRIYSEIVEECEYDLFLLPISTGSCADLVDSYQRSMKSEIEKEISDMMLGKLIAESLGDGLSDTVLQEFQNVKCSSESTE